MRKSVIVLLVLLLVFGALVLWGVAGYNRFVQLNESVDEAWSQVENVYQRRMELIPNLVETVKGAAEFEKETFTQVAEARAKAGELQLSSEMLNDPAALARFEQAQGSLSSALSRLLVTVEKYPELKANANFLALQDELAGTENRIATERRRFNDTVRTYNVRVKRFPSAVVAGLFGFDEKAYFESAAGADVAPKVEF